MFVLIYSNNELLTSDNTVETFPTYDRAYHEMVRQLEEEAARDGITLSEGPGDLTGTDETYGDIGWVGYLSELEAYLDHRGEAKWVIFEVPGALIPERACDGFRKSIREAADMYGNEDSDDWFDADDLCQQVCWELEGYLEEE